MSPGRKDGGARGRGGKCEGRGEERDVVAPWTGRRDLVQLLQAYISAIYQQDCISLNGRS